MTTGEQIKYIRTRRGLTQSLLAEMTGIHPVTIRKYETNKLQPKKEQIRKIADALKVSPIIFDGTDAGSTSVRSFGDMLGVLIMLYKSGVITTSNSEIRLTPALKDHLLFITTKGKISVNDSVIHLEDAQAEKDFFKWVKLYDNYLKMKKKYGSDKKLEAELLEEEAQLQTIEMELIMTPEEL